MKSIPAIRAAIPMLLLSASVAAASEVHLDVLAVRDLGNPDRIETGAFDFDGFTLESLPPVRVYENDLEEPFSGAGLLIGEAGFVALSATAAEALLAGTGYTHLPGGVDLRFDFNAFSLGGGPAANLWYWDGLDDDGDGDFAEDIDFQPAAGATLTFERSGGVFSASVDGGPGAVSGFVIAQTLLDNPPTDDEDETGFLHLDLDGILDDGDGNPLTLPPLGVYVLSLTLAYNPQSDPIFWVFNGGLGEAGEPAVEAAVAFVPEPATGLILALLAAACARRPRG